jgi:cephalosporin hydroxylase
MDPVKQFEAERAGNIARLGGATDLRRLALDFMIRTGPYKYTYNFTWLGRPVIQFPQDLMALQEIIWRVRPAVVVETGVAHGGSLVFTASMLHLLGGNGFVIGIDIDIRAHNRAAVEAHPFASRIRLVQGSSTAPEVLAQVKELIDKRGPVMVILDSDHTHAHVLRELELYAPLVTRGSYLIVMDTAIEDVPAELFPDRPWRKGNSPKSAVHAFLGETDRFRIDRDMEAKLLITVAPDGYLECVKD